VDLSHVLWIGGGQGSGASAIASELARRFDLQLYATDDHDRAHEPRMPRTGPTLDSGATPAELVDRFVTISRHRFRLVLEDLAALPPSPLAIVEGTQLFPTSVAAVLRDPSHALFVLSNPDAEHATGFDVLIARRFAWEASDLRLTTLPADAPLEELVERAAAHFLPVVQDMQISGAEDTSP
jgi:hypothetical protein